MLNVIQILILILAFIACVVAVRQIKQANMYGGLTWWMICLYWIVLTVKNIIDFIGTKP